MVYDEAVQTDISMAQNNFNNRVVKEGMDLWKKQKEFAHMKKLREQQEMREMLEKYWPWSSQTKPRGYKNLRLEELFPNKDYEKSKRLVGLLEWGKPGGGAPIKNTIRTKEDPILRFQFGKDLRRTVDNNFRYKTNKRDQQMYKKQLDELVEEKKLRTRTEKENAKEMIRKQFLKTPPWGRKGPGGRNWRPPNSVGLNFLKSLGWSTEHTLAALEEKSARYKENMQKKDEYIKKIDQVPPNKVIKLDPIKYPNNNLHVIKGHNKLSQLSEKIDNGMELVALLARDRKYPLKIPLTTTDITSEQKMGKTTIWNREGSAYLKELKNQMVSKRQRMKEMNTEENENAMRHFSTLDSFWGRPGNGAPLAEIKKHSLNRLLYPKQIPVSVH